MKKIRLLFLSLFTIGLISTSALFGQAVGDYQSVTSGTWGSTATWNTWDGGAWVAAVSTPSNASAAAVTIVSPNTVTVAASVSIRNVTVNSGAKVAVTGSATVLLTITDEGMTVNGSLDINGTSPSAAPYTVTMTVPAVLTIGSTGVVNYNQGGATATALPIATWLTGSTINITAITATTSFKAGGGQNFYNLNWNCPSQTGNFGWSLYANTIGGIVNISSTGTGRFYFFGGSSGTLNINGDLIVSGSSNVSTNGTGSGTTDIVNIYGIVNVTTTGNFRASFGTQGATGTSVFNFYNDVTISGIMGNSNTTTDGTKFVFKKSGTQNLTLTPTTLSGNGTPIEVDAGSTVNLLSTVNVTTLYLNGGIINSSASHPLVMGWWSGSALTSGTVSSLYTPSATSYVNGPMAFLYATAGTTTKTFPIGKGGIYRPLSLTFTQSAITLSTYTAEMFNAAPLANAFPGTLNGVEPYTASKVRYYNISESGSAFTAGSVNLSYDSDDGVSDIANLRIVQGPVAGGGTWVDLGGTGTASPTGTIPSTTPFTDLTTNTIFTLANNSGGTNPLPVELSSFTAANNGRNIQLNWLTKTEKNSDRFEVERSLQATTNWSTISSVKAAVLSNSPKTYSYSDTKLQSGKYQYRLKMIDNDGTYQYSKVENAEVAVPKNFTLSQNYPNPFNPSTKIDYQVPVDAKVVIDIYSITGQKVVELVNQEQSAGYYTVNFGSDKNLSSGIYLYRFSAVSKETGNNFSSIKKMILLK